MQVSQKTCNCPSRRIVRLAVSGLNSALHFSQDSDSPLVLAWNMLSAACPSPRLDQTHHILVSCTLSSHTSRINLIDQAYIAVSQYANLKSYRLLIYTKLHCTPIQENCVAGRWAKQPTVPL